MSDYKIISALNEEHKVYLVQSALSGNIYVQKILDVYNIRVYEYLYRNPVAGIPRLINYYEDGNQLIVIEEYISGTSLQEKIDNLDRQILEIISQNARIPFKDVAAECGVSRAAIHQRVQRLIDLGVIVGSGYHVNPKSLGYRTCTYVGIKLEKGSMYKAVVAELQNIPEIVECHFTTGPYTMLTKVYARDNEHLMDLLNNKMQEIPGVTATETLISLEQSIKKEIPIHADK